MTVIKRLIIAAVAIWAACAPSLASAQPAVIRDAEIEDIIRGYATPLLQAAGISPGDVDLILVNDEGINAFVAGGQNIFIYTGLLRKAGGPDEVIGVIAHEAGHIAGGHIARLGAEVEKASAEMLLSAVLGIAAAIASGRGDVGAAVALGGQGAAVKGLLAHTRVQESAADQAAFKYLEGSNRSAAGFVDLLQRLVDQELVSARYQDDYVRTHPLSRDRLDTAKAFMARTRKAGKTASPEELARFARMQAKLAGFMDPPQRTLDQYIGEDPNARYARSIAHYRRGDLARAIPLVDSLIEAEPTNPFLHELKGQMLFENARAEAAVEAYELAVKYRPNDPAILEPAARALMETGRPEAGQRAVEMLRLVVLREPRNPGAWRQLGIAYGKQGNIGDASVALAEAAMLRGQKPEAVMHARRAQANLSQGSTGWLKAEDILQTAKPLE